jgi:(p)ppGpp synthase/HD superfamily hydrolase
MADHDPHDAIHLSKRFFKATEWAAARHADRAHDALPVTPSLGQVLGIASLVLEDGGTEREAIAAMVLDAVGDDDMPIDEIRDGFGKKVARLVARCADERADAGRGARRLDADTWRKRRARALDLLEHDDDPSVLRVRAADALRELRTIVSELRRHGSIAFARFPAPPAEQLDHYRSLVAAFTRRMPRSHLDQELRAAVVEMDRLVELETATAAWRVAHIDAA